MPPKPVFRPRRNIACRWTEQIAAIPHPPTRRSGISSANGVEVCVIMPATRQLRTGVRDKGPLLGAHVSTRGGIASAIERACAIGCTAMQIFVKNNMQWFAKPLDSSRNQGLSRASAAPFFTLRFWPQRILDQSGRQRCRFSPVLDALLTRGTRAGKPAWPSLSRAASWRAHGPRHRGWTRESRGES